MTKTPEDGYLVPKAQAHFAMVLLFLLMVFDFVDRQIISALLPSIKAEWSLSDTQLGLLVSVVNISIAVLALPTAAIVDRWSRTRSIATMAVLWSCATGMGAFATNFFQLLTARLLVGAGEAGYSSGGTALLSALYPKRLRGTVVGIFQSGAMIGTVIGAVLGGVIAAHWGWRHAFGVVAIPGLLLALLAYFIKDYKTVPVSVAGNGSQARHDVSWGEVLGMILRKPVLVTLFIAQSAQLFFVATLGNWLPSFLHRVHELPIDKAGIRTGMILILSALGTAIGGFLVDKLVGKKLQGRLWGACVFALLTSALFATAFSLPTGTQQNALLFAGAFFMLAALGPVLAAVVDLVHPGMRASALGMLTVFTNVFGMALGPLAGGFLSDRYDLQTALFIISFVPLLAAVGYALTARGYERARVGEQTEGFGAAAA